MLLLRSINRVIDAILILSLLVICVSLAAQVALRYLLHSPLPWPEELSQFLLVGISFLGMYRAFEKNEHISLTWLPRRWRVQRYLRLFGLLCVVVFLVYIGWGGWKLTQTAWHQPSIALRLPMAIPYLIIPVSCVLSLIAVAITGWNILTGNDMEAPIEQEGVSL